MSKLVKMSDFELAVEILMLLVEDRSVLCHTTTIFIKKGTNNKSLEKSMWWS